MSFKKSMAPWGTLPGQWRAARHVGGGNYMFDAELVSQPLFLMIIFAGCYPAEELAVEELVLPPGRCPGRSCSPAEELFRPTGSSAEELPRRNWLSRQGAGRGGVGSPTRALSGRLGSPPGRSLVDRLSRQGAGWEERFTR